MSQSCFELMCEMTRKISDKYSGKVKEGWTLWVKEHEPDLWEVFKGCEDRVVELCQANKKQQLVTEMKTWEGLFDSMLKAFFDRDKLKQKQKEMKFELTEEDLL